MLHKHHIIPKYAGGTDDPFNLKEVTVEEHAHEHKILYEKHGKMEDFLAYRGLLGLISKKDILRELCSRKGKDNPNFGKCGPLHPGFGKKRPEHAEFMKLRGFGKNKTIEHRKKLTLSFRKRAALDPVASKTWKVVTPIGEELVITNMAKFCRDHQLNKGRMTTVSKTGKTHRGYHARKLG